VGIGISHFAIRQPGFLVKWGESSSSDSSIQGEGIYCVQFIDNFRPALKHPLLFERLFETISIFSLASVLPHQS
jgi:hypothetical protein